VTCTGSSRTSTRCLGGWCGTSTGRHRFTGTAILTVAQATDLGCLGYVARASGLLVDAHHDHPLLSRGFASTEYAHTDGDVLSRFLVRTKEIPASVAMITQLPRRPGRQPRTHDRPQGHRAGTGTVRGGVCEGWRGTIVHRVELDADGRLTRLPYAGNDL
jgi:Ni,Fe-hydrogenase III large subunit